MRETFLDLQAKRMLQYGSSMETNIIRTELDGKRRFLFLLDVCLFAVVGSGHGTDLYIPLNYYRDGQKKVCQFVCVVRDDTQMNYLQKFDMNGELIRLRWDVLVLRAQFGKLRDHSDIYAWSEPLSKFNAVFTYARLSNTDKAKQKRFAEDIGLNDAKAHGICVSSRETVP